MSAGQQLKAKYDFQATDKTMLSFRVADQFSLVRKTSKDWWIVRSTSGEEGLAPANYLGVYEVSQCVYILCAPCWLCSKCNLLKVQCLNTVYCGVH